MRLSLLQIFFLFFLFFLFFIKPNFLIVINNSIKSFLQNVIKQNSIRK